MPGEELVIAGRYAQYGGGGDKKGHKFEYGKTLLIDFDETDEKKLRGLLRFAGEALACETRGDLDRTLARWRHWLKIAGVENIPKTVAR